MALTKILSSMVSFVQAGIGTITRTAQDKLRENVSVNDFAGVDPTGVADSTAGIQAALNSGAKNILFPAGGVWKLTGYVKPPSGTAIYMRGTIKIGTKLGVPGGFDYDTVTDCVFDGQGGLITDPGVEANYAWNEETSYSPAIHIRRSSNIRVTGISLRYVVQGILASAFTSAWYANSGLVSGPGVTYCKNIVIERCNVRYSQVIGIAGTECNTLSILNNYVYRSGDSGIFVMISNNVLVQGNTHESTYGDGITDGSDGQGLSFEVVNGGIVRDNRIIGCSITGIDIKRGCDNILVTGNTVRDTQCASIAVRGGDMSSTANNRVTVENNTIIRHGFQHRTDAVSLPTYSITGGIYIGACKQITVRNNVINGYKVTPAIKCILAYTDFDFYHAKRGESFCVVSGNRISFVTDLGSDAGYNMTSDQPDGIYVSGVYDTVTVEDNVVQGNRVNLSDTRIGNNSAINIVPNTAGWGTGDQFFPKLLSVKNNKISSFAGMGVHVEADNVAYNTFGGSSSISGNQVVNVSFNAMRLIYLKSPNVSGNVCTSGGSTGAPQDTVVVSGCNGVVFSGNVIEKRTYPDADLGGKALSIVYTNPALYVGNRVNGPTDFTGSVMTSANNI